MLALALPALGDQGAPQQPRGPGADPRGDYLVVPVDVPEGLPPLALEHSDRVTDEHAGGLQVCVQFSQSSCHLEFVTCLEMCPSFFFPTWIWGTEAFRDPKMRRVAVQFTSLFASDFLKILALARVTNEALYFNTV